MADDTVTRNDRRELRKFARYLERVAGGMTQDQAYAETYGEVVFEDKSALDAPTGGETKEDDRG